MPEKTGANVALFVRGLQQTFIDGGLLRETPESGSRDPEIRWAICNHNLTPGATVIHDRNLEDCDRTLIDGTDRASPFRLIKQDRFEFVFCLSIRESRQLLRSAYDIDCHIEVVYRHRPYSHSVVAVEQIVERRRFANLFAFYAVLRDRFWDFDRTNFERYKVKAQPAAGRGQARFRIPGGGS